MKYLKPGLFGLLVCTIAVFGFLNSESYAEFDSMAFVVSIVSLIALMTHVHSVDGFRTGPTNFGLTQLVFGLGWKSRYHLITTALMSLVVSSPLLVSMQLKAFVILYSCCYFQSLIILSVVHVAYDPRKRNVWQAAAMVLLLIVIVSDKLGELGTYLQLFNPFLALSFSPYYFSFEMTLSNLFYSAALSYGVVFICAVFVKIKYK